MNRQETLALFAKGKDAWNAWANEMLAEKTKLQAAGKWQVDETGLGKTDETEAWLEATTANFSDNVHKHTFADAIDFRDWVFPGDMRFIGATFIRDAWFNGKTFPGDARFEGVTFTGNAWFDGVTFTRSSPFNRGKFKGTAGFGSATFTGDAWFDGATFTRDARFDGAMFMDEARFDGGTFTGDAWFTAATFTNAVRFDGATFTNDVFFNSAEFQGLVLFHGAAFFGQCTFDEATFCGQALFQRSTFKQDARFRLSRFLRPAWFSTAKFHGPIDFTRAVFRGVADFQSITSEVGLTLSDADFARVPDLRQATLHREPQLDNVTIGGFRDWWGLLNWIVPIPFPQFDRRGWARKVHYLNRTWTLPQWPLSIDREAPAKFRVLKSYAGEANDRRSELEFNAQEARKSRFVSDYPLPGPAWLKVLTLGIPLFGPVSGVFRFWLGLAYSMLSNFGRSVAIPLALWAAVLFVSVLAYLGESPDVAVMRMDRTAATTLDKLIVYGEVSATAFFADQSCIAPSEPPAAANGQPTARFISGLAPEIRAQTSAASEALQLAFNNAFVIGLAGPDSTHRSYGCLYGVERYGDNPVAYVPASVARIAAFQKFLSAILIFLFGLGLRNMLKLK